jgi:preprotein translocase subunit Sss1
MKVLMIVGLALTVIGALVLAWVDLTAKKPTWDSLVTEWQRRRKFATTGFALIAAGTIVQVVAIPLD